MYLRQICIYCTLFENILHLFTLSAKSNLILGENKAAFCRAGQMQFADPYMTPIFSRENQLGTEETLWRAIANLWCFSSSSDYPSPKSGSPLNLTRFNTKYVHT